MRYWLKRLAYMGCWIIYLDTKAAGVEKYRTNPLLKPPRCLDRAAIFNLAQDLKQ